MEPLLTAIMLWLSANFGLPAADHPRIEFVPSVEMAALRHKGLLSARTREVVALRDQPPPPAADASGPCRLQRPEGT